MMTDVNMAKMLEKMYTDEADEFVKRVEPMVKRVDMSRMTNEDLLMQCRRAFEAGIATGVSLIPSIHKNLGIPLRTTIGM